MTEDYDGFVMYWESPQEGQGKTMSDLNLSESDMAAQVKTS